MATSSTLFSSRSRTSGNQAAVTLTARSLLPAKFDYLWQIESGFVRCLTWLEDGTTVVLGIWGDGEIVGKPSTQADTCQIECMTKVKATPVPIVSLSNYPSVLLEHMNQLENLMQIRSYKRVDLMLLRFLNWLSERFGRDTPQGRLIDLRLTHLDIAESIGTTRVTVTRILNQFEQQGVIKYLPLKRIVLCEADPWHYEI
ncbi:MAG: Crp/Fnr family transcriptional regulator [Elainella sp. C42_A2020_010]|nr:Crp/Fnr family transcriptional regulator [Elainella sp. C42_A2020_010]